MTQFLSVLGGALRSIFSWSFTSVVNLWSAAIILVGGSVVCAIVLGLCWWVAASVTGPLQRLTLWTWGQFDLNQGWLAWPGAQVTVGMAIVIACIVAVLFLFLTFIVALTKIVDWKDGGELWLRPNVPFD